MEPGSVTRNDLRRTVEQDQVHRALQHTLGIVYPNDRPKRITVELISCGLCGRQYERAVGSGILFCNSCIAEMRT